MQAVLLFYRHCELPQYVKLSHPLSRHLCNVLFVSISDWLLRPKLCWVVL